MNKRTSKLIRKFVVKMNAGKTTEQIRKEYQKNKKLWNSTTKPNREITRKILQSFLDKNLNSNKNLQSDLSNLKKNLNKSPKSN